jgi:lysophospholipase L1-like esterase
MVSKERVPNKDVVLINPAFLKDAHYKLSPGRNTIVTLGDSYTEGYPVARRDNYPSVLHRLLAQQGWVVNLVNMGIGDSAPDQHLRLFKQFVLPRIKLDIVVWSFYLNDIDDNLRFPTYRIEDDALVPLDGRWHWLFIRRSFHEWVPLPPSVKNRSRVLRLLYRALEVWGRDRLRRGGPAKSSAYSIAKMRLAIEEMEQMATSHGFATHYVLIAPQSMYMAKETYWSTDTYRQIHDVFRHRRDLIEAFFRDIPAPLASGLGIFAAADRDPNALGDRHFNENGYRLLAETVAKRLVADRQRDRAGD